VDDLLECVRFANAVATLCVQKRCAIPAFPSIKEVMDFLAQLNKLNVNPRLVCLKSHLT